MTNELLPAVSTLPTLELHFAAGSANGVWCRTVNAQARKKLHALRMWDARSKAPDADPWVCVPICDGRFARPALRDFNQAGANGVEIFTRPHPPGSHA